MAPRLLHVVPAAARAFARMLAGLGVCAAFTMPGAARAAPDLQTLVATWVRGDFRAPLVCEIDGEPRRGLRRVLVTRGSPTSARPSSRIVFFDLEAEGATRCFDELGSEQPNVEGTIEVSLEANSPPDVARRDFKASLRREGGFTLRIDRGSLRLTAVGDPGAHRRIVDFSGGTAVVRPVVPGSDAARLLADLRGRRALTLALEAPDGTRLVLPLVERPPPRR